MNRGNLPQTAIRAVSAPDLLVLRHYSMNTGLLTAVCALSGLLRLEATEAGPPPCCPAPAAEPACCRVEEPATAPCCVGEQAATPLTAKSLYQLQADWTNDAGASLRLASLRGKPVVLAMFFAQCEYACPILVNDIQRLHAALLHGLFGAPMLVGGDHLAKLGAPVAQVIDAYGFIAQEIKNAL